MALDALCGDDTWGRTWSRVVQHRFGGTGDLNGHSLGNLLIMSLWEETGDVVAGLDWVAALLGAQGRVLPVSLTRWRSWPTSQASMTNDPTRSPRSVVRWQSRPPTVWSVRSGWTPTNRPPVPKRWTRSLKPT